MGEPMTDRVLLERAAKAAGYKVRWHENWQCFAHTEPHNITSPPTLSGQRHVWVPLDDDGDALRLAVKLQLELYHAINADRWSVFVGYPKGQRIAYAVEEYGDDEYAATRRAIVRAAASLADSRGASQGGAG